MIGSDRAQVLQTFLARCGWAGAERAILAGDASFRRYDRLTRTDGTAVLMDAPPPQEDVRPFVNIARHLVSLGYSAPEILGADEVAGLLLLEDLGDDRFSRVLADSAAETPLYEAAIDLIVSLQNQPVPGNVAPYDRAALLREADLIVDWYLPAVGGGTLDQAGRHDWHAAWDAVLAKATLDRSVLVLRDYHADNLMWLPDRSGLAKVGLLDFQDALIGSPAYDVVSLLEDARRDVAPDLAEAMVARFVAAVPSLDLARFKAAYAVLGAQRNAKIIGIFTRLWKRDGKPAYLDLIPRVWGLLERDLSHPELAPVRHWFDRHLPPTLRTVPAVD